MEYSIADVLKELYAWKILWKKAEIKYLELSDDLFQHFLTMFQLGKCELFIL